jgi:hypothetical protein
MDRGQLVKERLDARKITQHIADSRTAGWYNVYFSRQMH